MKWITRSNVKVDRWIAHGSRSGLRSESSSGDAKTCGTSLIESAIPNGAVNCANPLVTLAREVFRIKSLRFMAKFFRERRKMVKELV